MRRLLLWMFLLKDKDDRWERAMKVAALLIFYVLPLLAAAMLWKVSNGLAICVGLMLFAVTAFFGTSWYRWNVLEPRRKPGQDEPSKIARRAHRSARTEWWRKHILWLAEHDQGKQGDRARSILKSWKEVSMKNPAPNLSDSPDDKKKGE